MELYGESTAFYCVHVHVPLNISLIIFFIIFFFAHKKQFTGGKIIFFIFYFLRSCVFVEHDPKKIEKKKLFNLYRRYRRYPVETHHYCPLAFAVQGRRCYSNQ